MSALPVGQHLVCIVNAEGKANSKGTGTFAALTMECIGERHTGATHTDRLNLNNPNETAVRIANERFAEYLTALGLQGAALSDPQEICFLPFIVDLVAGKDGDRREVKSVCPCPQDWKPAADAACAQLRSRLPTPPPAPASTPVGSAEPNSPNVIGWGEFVATAKPPVFVWHRVLQAGYLYALTAYWGAGKTAIAVGIALHVAAGRELAGHATDACKVLYLSGENPADVAMRAKKAAEVFGIDDAELAGNIHFTQRPFAIDNPEALASFVGEAKEHGPFGLIIIDTGPAHSEAQDEDDNRQAHKLAMALRELMAPLGNPAALVLMHPAKNASQENMTPRGGGAFAGSVDGLLCAWQDEGVTELYRHAQKFRGPHFEPMCFKMERHTVDGMTDNFDEPVETVVAVALDADERRVAKEKSKPLTGANLIAHDALIELQSQAEPVPTWLLHQPQCIAFAPAMVVHKDKWRDRCIVKGISSGNADAGRKAFDRAFKHLLKFNKVQSLADQCWAYEWVRPKKELIEPAPGMLVSAHMGRHSV